jgi:hypothetical protein
MKLSGQLHILVALLVGKEGTRVGLDAVAKGKIIPTPLIVEFIIMSK